MKPFALILALACAFAAAAAPRASAQASKLAEAKDLYVKNARAAIEELSRKIDSLEKKLKTADAAAHEDRKSKLAGLKARRKTLLRRLTKLKRASGKAWGDLKAGVDQGIEDLRAAVDENIKV